MRILSLTVSVLFFCSSTPTIWAEPPVDRRWTMEDRLFASDTVPRSRPYWFEFTRTDIGTDGWSFSTLSSYFGRPPYLNGTTIAFYDDNGALLYQNRRASAALDDSYIGFGMAFDPNFGVGSPTMPDFNRPYYLGVGGIDTDFFPNFTFTRGTDRGDFVAEILPAPGPAATLAAAALFAARRRRPTGTN